MRALERLIPVDTGPEGLLSIYLNDHRSGAEGAMALASRSARSNADNDVGAYLTGHFLPELRVERARLESARTALDVADNPFKQWAARVGEFVGRAKLNGAVSGYSPLSRVVELELLIAGVATKRQLWRSLGTVSAGGGFDDDIARADEQIDRLTELHRWAVSEAFYGVSIDIGPAPADGDST